MRVLSFLMAFALLLEGAFGEGTAASAYVVDLASPTRAPLPTWLDVINRTQDELGHGTLEIPIKPAEDVPHLAVTLIFLEKKGQTLSVSWRADGDPKPFVLAKNVLEELNGVHNQRILVIERALIGNGGTLVIDYSSPDVSPSRLVFDWVSPNPVLTDSSEAPPAFIGSSGRRIDSRTLAGNSFSADPDKVNRNIVDATLIGEAEEFDDALQVEVPLTDTVRAARVSTSLLGIPLNVGVSVYVNNHYAGELQVEMPALDDPGYDWDNGSPVYAGWRNATLVLPGTLLKSEGNTITLAPSATDSHATLNDPAYIRDTRLQVVYGNSASPAL